MEIILQTKLRVCWPSLVASRGFVPLILMFLRIAQGTAIVSFCSGRRVSQLHLIRRSYYPCGITSGIIVNVMMAA
ncbi:hypothetical protein B0H66DRAFT_558689 [Apodospora peruviana]|uniref:Uncharacterized protein n=1 Tax=Apodospora peruviana TaxID=516989 RepID=A0AAE0I6L0_9PEZI|nr:hypothetical protein B0H66DRAFT_571495 [Apodospora peruviana]KAK3319062.1 hypothetical protein B0H66DRAFT_558689 [Apodospora peruviana]